MKTAEQIAVVEIDLPSARSLPAVQQERAVVTPMDMLSRAVETGADMAVLEKLMALQERWEANQARKAFDEAMAEAKSEIPVILKNKAVDYEHNNGGGKTSYRHEDLGEIARTVDPILAKHGLSYRFRTTSNPNEPVSVTCIVAHRDGHSETNTLSAGKDESGKKNSIQAIGSTITYLQRYTLKAALGLAAASDDDGKGADQSSATERAHITEAQIADLRDLISEAGTTEAAFCKQIKIPALANIYADKFGAACGVLRQRIRGDR
jgi:hypothetical protein